MAGAVAPAFLVLWCAPAHGQIPQGNITIELQEVASSLVAPLDVTHAGDGSGRLFIVDQAGKVRIVEKGKLLATPFLDITARIPVLNAGFDERGLLGLAFHPDYPTNGRFFVRYSAPRVGAPGEPCFGTSRGCHEEILAEYAVSDTDPNLADPDSEIIHFRVDEPQFNHNGGKVAFGPDGFLYFTLGDGGGANDGLADTPPSHGPIGNAQNIDVPLGKLLRLDVDSPPEPGLAYAIPDDNPFVNADGLDEIYAYGLRNPFKFSFDDEPGGDGSLYLADVGQGLFEEINLIENGGNYGWVLREGFHCFDPFNNSVPPFGCEFLDPARGYLGEPLIKPLVEYSHPGSGFNPEGGITVIGGFVYRGSGLAALVGRYVFGDFAQAFNSPSGRLYYLIEPKPGVFAIRQFRIGLNDRPYGRFLHGFGRDDAGELYVCGTTLLGPTGATGVVERIIEPPPPIRGGLNRGGRENLPRPGGLSGRTPGSPGQQRIP